MTNHSENKSPIKRQLFFIVIPFIFIALYALFRDSGWQGNKQLHTVMETIATLLAFGAGLLALIRFYAKKSNTYLFIAAAFIGTALLDGYHAIITSVYFDYLFPSHPENLIPWSWSVSRLFLAIAMFVSYWAWTVESQNKNLPKIREKNVYIIISTFILITFIIFALIPLPQAYYPDLLFGRPEEFVAALFFLFALIGYYKKGLWKNSYFEYWIVVSLIIGFLGQALFMPLSSRLFDFQFEVAHLLKKMSYLCIHTGLLTSFYYLFRDSEKQKIQILAEIKERELAEKNMAKYRGRNELILNCAVEGIIGLDREGKHTFANPAALQILGYTDDEMIGKESHSMWHHSKEDGTKLHLEECPIHNAMLKEESFSIDRDLFWHKDGTPIHVQYSVSPLKQNQKVLGSMIVFQDVTKIHHSEVELHKLSYVIEQSPTIIVITDLDGKIEYVNPAFTKSSGYTSKEVIGKSPSILASGNNGNGTDELWETIRSGKTWKGEFHNRKKNGELFWDYAIISPLKDKNGKTIQYLGLQTDITNNKKSEKSLREYANALEKSNKELEDFAHIASHDLQEPLRKVITFGNRLRDKFQDELSDNAQDYLNRMNNAATRMRILINDLLDFSRITSKAKEFEEVNLNEILKEVLQNLEIKIEDENATINIDRLETIEGDPSQLYRLFQNVIGNALKYRKEDLNPEISVYSKLANNEDGEILGQKYQHIHIEDNGIGFDEKYIDKIFAPFQRLHGRQEYEGTGMGLAICNKIVTRHNGFLSAKSTPGSGSSFTIVLPLQQENKEII